MLFTFARERIIGRPTMHGKTQSGKFDVQKPHLMYLNREDTLLAVYLQCCATYASPVITHDHFSTFGIHVEDE
jgi:hypothetical protein